MLVAGGESTPRAVKLGDTSGGALGPHHTAGNDLERFAGRATVASREPRVGSSAAAASPDVPLSESPQREMRSTVCLMYRTDPLFIDLSSFDPPLSSGHLLFDDSTL